MIIEKKAYAKINLYLEILKKLANGYHEMDMLIQSVDLHDLIQVEDLSCLDISISCNDKNIPMDKNNDVYKAAAYTREYYNIKKGYHINIQKNIPIAAGLGGGSSDAAATIKAILEIENIAYNSIDVNKIGLKIGAEMPYSLESGLCKVSGIGERVEKLDFIYDLYFCIVNPGLPVLTKDVFNLYSQLNNKVDINKINTRDTYTSNILNLIEFLKTDFSRETFRLKSSMINSLESATFSMNPELMDIKNELLKLGAINTMMSGSGPSIYGIFGDFESAIKAETFFKNKCFKSFAVKPIFN